MAKSPNMNIDTNSNACSVPDYNAHPSRPSHECWRFCPLWWGSLPTSFESLTSIHADSAVPLEQIRGSNRIASRASYNEIAWILLLTGTYPPKGAISLCRFYRTGKRHAAWHEDKGSSGDERSSAKDGVREDGRLLLPVLRPITTPCYRPNWILIIV